LAAVVAGANVHDAKLLEATIDAMFIQRPEPDEIEQHLCLDKGYDNPSGHRAALEAEYIPHIRRIGEERLDAHGRRRRPARRWVAERAIAWLNQCRAILVRFAKKASNYMGMIKLAIVLLWYRRARAIGDLR
jgi:putative transposase